MNRNMELNSRSSEESKTIHLGRNLLGSYCNENFKSRKSYKAVPIHPQEEESQGKREPVSRQHSIDFENVSYVKELKFNLLSVSQICDKKHNVNCPSGGETCLVAKASEDEAILWHRRLGHMNFKNINKLVKNSLVRDTLHQFNSGHEAYIQLGFILNRVIGDKPQMKTPMSCKWENLFNGALQMNAQNKDSDESTVVNRVPLTIEDQDLRRRNSVDNENKNSGKRIRSLISNNRITPLMRGAIDKTLVQVYVDDIIFGSTKTSMVKEFEELMQKEFTMSSLGELTFFLGLQVKQSTAGIFISQDKYVKDILNKFDFRTIKPATTPIEAHKALGKDEEGEDVDVHLYRSMIGCLMYLTASRPDIMFAVCLCARFQVTPKVSHMNAVKRIFRYLKHQPKLGLWYPKDSPFHLEAFSDSDYAGDNHDRRSTSGGCQYLGRRLVSWQCKKQTIVAISSTEAEYVAAASCCGQVLWMQNQLFDYGFNFMNTDIHIDNKSTICIVKNPVFHLKTKHIQIRHHFIRDCYDQRLINVVKVHTDDNVADLLTKGFDLERFNSLVVNIGMMNP
ncbi:putative ribonuclease H-like domain-containing protein [Tanacetum coccineum]